MIGEQQLISPGSAPNGPLFRRAQREVQVRLTCREHLLERMHARFFGSGFLKHLAILCHRTADASLALSSLHFRSGIQ